MTTMHRCVALLPLLFVTLLTATSVQAQDELLRCAVLTDDAARLECYDSLAAALRSELAREAAEVVPNTAGNPATDAAAAASATVEPVRSGVRTALAVFGFESRPEEQRAITEVLDSVEAAVTSAAHNPFSGWTLTLDNGQVWRQLGSDRFDIKPGDKAVITRGSLNSFLLQRSGAGRRIRVTRVE